RALDLGVAGVADQHHVATGAAMARDLEVHLGHQRAGRVEHLQSAPLRLLAHRARDAVGAEDHGAAVGHLVELFDEDRPAALEVLDHEAVVHHLVPHVDRRPEGLDGALDDLDRAIDAGAETAGIGEDDVHGGHSSAPGRNPGATRRRPPAPTRRPAASPAAATAARGGAGRPGSVAPDVGPTLEQAEQHDPDRPAHYRAVGNVERRPVVVAPVPLDEIDHMAVQLAIDHVA